MSRVKRTTGSLGAVRARGKGAESKAPRLHVLLSRSLRHSCIIFEQRLVDARRKCSEGAIHELRVASRRLSARLQLLGTTLRGLETETPRRMLKGLVSNLGELRDSQVQAAYFAARVSKFPELLLLRDAAERTARRLKPAARRRVNDFKAGRLKRCVGKVADGILVLGENQREDQRLSRRLLAQVEQAFGETLKCWREIRAADLETIHRTRVSFKRFRYMVEALSPTLTGLERKELRVFAAYQRRMGTIQDLQVIQGAVERYAGKHEWAPRLYERFGQDLERTQARALRGYMRHAGEIRNFWAVEKAEAGIDKR